MIYYDTTAIDAVNDGRDTPDAFYEPGHPSVLMATSKYKSIDGWRGYSEITPEPGFKLLEGDEAGDWLTGDWDDAPYGHSSTELEAKIKALEAKYGNIYVIYTPTSNVFSTSYDVLVRDPTHKPTHEERGRVIAKATRRWDYSDGSFKVRYHATNVVSYDAKTGRYTLDTGGWNTMTTGKRMTEALPAGWYVYRKNWVMYLHRPGLADIEIVDGAEYEFYEDGRVA